MHRVFASVYVPEVRAPRVRSWPTLWFLWCSVVVPSLQTCSPATIFRHAFRGTLARNSILRKRMNCVITCQTFDHVSNSKWSLVKLGPEHVTLDGVENTCAERRLRARRGLPSRRRCALPRRTLRSPPAGRRALPPIKSSGGASGASSGPMLRIRSTAKCALLLTESLLSFHEQAPPIPHHLWFSSGVPMRARLQGTSLAGPTRLSERRNRSD